MSAEDLIKAGDLDGALAALQDNVRRAADDPKLRVFLFQLLCIKGDWKRAILQLKTAATLDPAANTMAQMYREAIICEVFREKVFSGDVSPLILGEPSDWLAWLVQALQSDPSTAADLRAKAFEAAPATPGTINDTPFAWLADADSRLGPVLEVILDGKYFWAPFDAIHSMKIESPTDLRDAVWTPATITWTNGGDAIGLIPTRYIGSETPAHRLARGTDWAADGTSLGQRMWVTDSADVAIMDVRELVFDHG